MKKITILILIIFATWNISFAQSLVEKEAIKSFCGCFEVEFKYSETFAHTEDYEFHEPFSAKALELVVLEEESPTKMVMQHILVLSDTFFIKHWRQDWEYQPNHLFAFKGEETWKTTLLTSDQNAGLWSQEVYGVYDQPRYAGSASWFLADGRKVWVNTSDAPLPRREYKKRKDYQILRRTNSLHIKDWGWIHEQDNEKVAIDKDGNETIIVEEKGKNTYTKVDPERCKKGAEWWEKNKKNWKAVRYVWDELLMESGTYKVERRHEDGDYMPKKMEKFAKAEFETEEEAQEAVREIIKKHRSAVTASSLGSNIFHDRSFWKTMPGIEEVNQKIEEGNDPIALNPFAFDAVTYATLENAPLKTIKYLLGMKGNEVDKITHDGRNYLMWAAYKGNLELTQFLIDEGSQTDIVDDHGYNLMTFAAVAGQANPEVYDLILKNGGKIDDTNREGANALLLLAPHLKDNKMIDYFLEKGLDLQATDNDGNGLFNYAARMGNIEMMDKFIEMGLPYKNINKIGGNAMIFASLGFRRYTNPLSVYEYLEGKGVKPNVLTQEGVTPLHSIAFRTKDYAIFEYFINKGVDINQADDEGNTVFFNSIKGGNFDIAKKLLPSVKDINHQNKDGHSALTYAVRRNDADFVNYLLSNGATPDVKDKKGNDLVYHAFDTYKSGKQEDFNQITEVLNSKGLNYTAKQSDNNTLLHLAVEKGELFLVEKALNHGIAINEKNNDGLTPLHMAAMKAADGELLLALLQHGADKSILTDFDESAFDLASENELLKKTGVDIGFLK